VAASPALVSAHLGIAKALQARGDSDAALNALAESARQLPADRTLPLARAESLTRLKRYEAAIAAYDEVLQRHPDDETAINNLAYLLAEVKGDVASAQRALKLAARFSESRNAGKLDSLGWIHYRLGEYSKALPLLERAVALSPSTPLLQLHLGKTLVKTGERERGQALIRQAIEKQPDLPRLDEARALLAQG
jgi:cellulose synthase operon protein C